MTDIPDGTCSTAILEHLVHFFGQLSSHRNAAFTFTHAPYSCYWYYEVRHVFKKKTTKTNDVPTRKTQRVVLQSKSGRIQRRSPAITYDAKFRRGISEV